MYRPHARGGVRLLFFTHAKGETVKTLNLAFTVLTAVLGGVILSTAVSAADDFQPNGVRANMEDAANSFIFVFRDDVAAGNVRGMAQEMAAAGGGNVRHMFSNAIKGFSANMSATAAARLADKNPAIAYYEPNGIVWAIARPGGGGGSEGQTLPWGVNRVGGPASGSGLHAWIIDTGIDLDHPDLNVGSGANFVTRGKNSPDDGNGHGTHVAGTVAAIDNTVDVVGVAAGATVHPVRVLDNSGSGTIDGVVAGVDYVAGNASSGDCANMSLSASGHFQSLHDAVLNAAGNGINFAIAASNDGDDANNYEPAHVEHNNVFTISAIDSSDTLTSWSNYGNPPVDFAAPGASILSTKKGGGTTTMSGTSMAAPHVCGLLLFGNPSSDGTAGGDPDGDPDPIAHF